MVGYVDEIPVRGEILSLLRQAIRQERKLCLHYHDLSGADSERTVWPLALGYFERVRVLVAWCELRGDFRHFRADRILDLTMTGQTLPRRPQALLAQWRKLQGMGPALI